MTRALEFSATARGEYLSISHYLRQQFGPLTASRRLTAIEEKLNTLAMQPEMGRKVPAFANHVRRFVLHPRLIVYYRVEPERLYILHLHDTRLPSPEDV